MGRGFPDLVGRAMVDPDFLAELQRAPEPAMAEFDLTEEEREVVRRAVERLASMPAAQRTLALHATLLRRVAT